MRCSYGLQFGRPSSQSSTGWGGKSSRAVDGKYDSHFNRRSCTHTKKEKGWWAVDLQERHNVTKVHVYTRTDCCQIRALDAQVYVDKTMCTGRMHREQGKVSNYAISSFNCNGTMGRVVKVQMVRKDYLTLCEVVVRGSLVVSGRSQATLGEQFGRRRKKKTTKRKGVWSSRKSRAKKSWAQMSKKERKAARAKQDAARSRMAKVRAERARISREEKQQRAKCLPLCHVTVTRHLHVWRRCRAGSRTRDFFRKPKNGPKWPKIYF